MGIVGKVTDKIILGHHLQIEKSLCSRFRTPKSGCSLCADACPAGAISFPVSGAEITGECADCGVCFSVCPNGVFRMSEANDEEILGEISAAAAGCKPGEAKTFRISCQWGDGKAGLLVPCIGRLTEGLLVETVKAGFSKVELVRPECGACRNAKASPHIDKMLSLVSALFEMLGIGEEKFEISRIPLQPWSKKADKPVSRRTVISALGIKVAEVAAAALPEIAPEKGGPEQTFIDAINKRPANVKRMFLKRALRKFAPVKDVYVPAGEVPVARVEVSPHCCACGVCVTLCPTGALAGTWEDGRFRLSFKPALCTHCRVCVETCMPGTIKIKGMSKLNDLLEGKEINLFEARKETCPVCGLDFVRSSTEVRASENAASALQDVCALCLDRHKKHMTFMKHIQNGLKEENGNE